MRKYFLISLLLAMITDLAGAQTLSNFVKNGAPCMIPGALTKDGNAVLYMWDYDNNIFSILDENFQVVEKFSVPNSDDILDDIHFVFGSLGNIESDHDLIDNSLALLKDVFAPGYNYMCLSHNEMGIDIYNSENKKVSYIEFPKGYEYEYYVTEYGFLIMDKYKYFVIKDLSKGKNDKEQCVAFYRIDNINSSVKLVSVASSAKISPRAPRKGENVTVTVDSEMEAKDCIIQVVSASGKSIMEKKIPSGQSQVEISTDGFPKGVYVVTVYSEDVQKEAAKIIIR